MALTNSCILPNKSLVHHHQSSILTKRRPSILPISAVHAAEPANNPVVSDKPQKQQQQVSSSSSAATKTATVTTTTTKTDNVVRGKWTVDSWKSKKALQLPEYPDQEELESVLKTLENFPPIVFAGEARSLEDRLAEAAMGNAFLLQGGDCAESFKEFNANNIRDTFRILLQMGAVLMFGGQMPVIKVSFYFLIFSALGLILKSFILESL